MTRERQAQRVLDLWRQATAARLTRREAYKLGLMAGTAGLFANRRLWAASGSVSTGSGIVSPPTRPFMDAMLVPPVLQPVAPFGTGEDHQYYKAFPPKKFYSVREKEEMHRFHRDLPMSPIWGFEGITPGPTIDMHYGEPVLLKFSNQLPADHTGFGVPQCIEHMHNGHTASESDGGPWRWTEPGQAKYYHHCMQRAGFANPTLPGPDGEQWRDGQEPEAGSGFNGFGGGDLRETLTTLFLHYHRPSFTADGVYKGLVNIIRFFDDMDAQDETKGWRLPWGENGEYDIPIVLTDKQFDPNTGELIFDQFNLDGFLGDRYGVNGKIQPYFEVKRRKYRFRVLDGGPSRLYDLVFRYKGKTLPFTQITDNGNLLEEPRKNLQHLEFWIANRHDIIVDFSQCKSGDKVYLANTLVMKDGRGPDRSQVANPDKVENQLVEFRVGGDARDDSRVPGRDILRPFAPVIIPDNVVRRHWRFERGNGMWQVNGQLWDPDIDHREPQLSNPDTQIKRDASEIWTIENKSGGWVHPIHIHLEEGQILSVNGQAPTGLARARKDVYHLDHDTKIEIFLRFRDYPDPEFAATTAQRLGEYTRYPMHCHNMTHEDHAMMKTWNVVPEPTV